MYYEIEKKILSYNINLSEYNYMDGSCHMSQSKIFLGKSCLRLTINVAWHIG